MVEDEDGFVVDGTSHFEGSIVFKNSINYSVFVFGTNLSMSQDWAVVNVSQPVEHQFEALARLAAVFNDVNLKKNRFQIRLAFKNRHSWRSLTEQRAKNKPKSPA